MKPLRVVLEKYLKYFSFVITVIAGMSISLMSYWLGSGAGTLLISSDPTNDEIIINDSSYGKTPSSVELDRGTYKIAISKSGFYRAEKIVKIVLVNLMVQKRV